MNYVNSGYAPVRATIVQSPILYQFGNIGHLIDSLVDHLIVSVDGATAEICNQYRVGGDFERVLAGLWLLRDEKLRRQVTRLAIEWQFIVVWHTK